VTETNWADLKKMWRWFNGKWRPPIKPPNFPASPPNFLAF